MVWPTMVSRNGWMNRLIVPAGAFKKIGFEFDILIDQMRSGGFEFESRVYLKLVIK